jgi:hypothetical protein
MKIRLAIVCICLGLVCGNGTAQADQVYSANLEFSQTYSQSVDNTLGPVTAQTTEYILSVTSGSDLSAVSVTTPNATTVNLSQNPPGEWTQTTSGAPVSGTYVFNTTGATISSQTIDNTVTVAFPTQETLAGSSIENLAAANGTANVNLSLTYYSVNDSPDWTLYDTTTTQTRVGGTGIPSANFQIPAADITPGHSYLLELVSTGGMSGVMNSINVGVGYGTETDITFGATATPEPSTMVMILFAGALFIPVLRKARSRAAQVA